MSHAGTAGMQTIRLGLIGDNIARSQAPRLHELAGRLTGIPVSYERLIPQRPRPGLRGGVRRAPATPASAG